MNPDLLVNRLIERGELTQLELGVLKQEPEYRELPIEQALLEEGLVEEDTLLETMAEVYSLPSAHLQESMLDRKTAATLPPAMLRNFDIFPLLEAPSVELGEGEILLAMADPFDVTATDAIRLVTHKKVKRILAPRSHIRAAIAGELAEDGAIREILQRIPQDMEIEYVEKIIDEPESEEDESAAPIIQLVNSLVSDGIRMLASDIHFEPLADRVRVRYRVDGMLRSLVELPKRVQKACTSRFKLISGIDIAESRRPQDGRSRVRSKTREVDLRVSTIPTFFGEKVVLRILDRSAVVLEMEQLGLLPGDLEVLSGYLRASQGMILNTGPTGSGKTSTLYAALKQINREEVNILTVEDPVEYQLDGVNQVQVNPKSGLTFANALRHFLRQDPDIVMLGEIRDLETAEIAVQAAQTGHLVLSTLHTNDAPSTFSRIILMGLAPYMVAGSLLCIVAQRLVRRLCQNCKEEVQPNDADLRLLRLAPEQVFPQRCFRAAGCAQCQHRGYKGRVGLFEILAVTERLRGLMTLGISDHELWHEARKEGMNTLLEDGIKKVDMGLTSLEEVLRVVTLRRQGEHLEELKAEAPEPSLLESLPVPPHSLPSEEVILWKPPQSVREVMTTGVVTAAPDLPLEKLVELLVENGVQGVPVVNSEGILVGTVSYTDLAIHACHPGEPNTTATASDIMSSTVVTIRPEATVDEARTLFQRYRLHRLVVCDDEGLLGILSPLDLFRVSAD